MKNPIIRPDDRRLGPRPEHVPNDVTREKVKDLSRVISAEGIGILMGISKSTVHKHYAEELAIGHNQAMAAIGTKMIEKALTGHFGAMAFTLSRRGGWSEKLHLRAPGGLIRNYNLTGKTPEELSEALSLLDDLIANRPELDEADVS